MYTGLSATWFALIGLLFAGYFVLEGFDFGVGIVGPLVSRNEIDRRLCLNAIGPTWDGNEVWLITAGGAMFAAFPLWYGKLFNGAYLALFLVLLALIVRNVSFEFRGRVDDRPWRRTWDAANFGGSLVATLVWGVAFTNFAHGLPLTAAGYTGGLFGLLNPLALLGGLAVVALFAWLRPRWALRVFGMAAAVLVALNAMTLVAVHAVEVFARASDPARDIAGVIIMAALGVAGYKIPEWAARLVIITFVLTLAVSLFSASAGDVVSLILISSPPLASAAYYIAAERVSMAAVAEPVPPVRTPVRV